MGQLHSTCTPPHQANLRRRQGGQRGFLARDGVEVADVRVWSMLTLSPPRVILHQPAVFHRIEQPERARRAE